MLDVRRQDLSLRTLRFEASDTGKSFTRNAPICARGEDVPLAAWPETVGSGRPDSSEVVHDRPISVHERVSAPRIRLVLPAGRVPVPVPAHARVQRAPSAELPLHGPPDPGRREADRGERAEAMGDPAPDGDPGPGDPEVRGPDALDRGVPRGDDGGPE